MPSFTNPDTTFFPEAAGQPVRVITNPGSGTTVQLNWTDRAVYISLSGTLAALTVKMPRAAQAGQTVELLANYAITTLTLQTSTGGAIAGAPTTLAVSTLARTRFVNSTVGWIDWA